jgi:hypothetical protein
MSADEGGRTLQEYRRAVEAYFTERGWELDRTQVAETVWLYGATNTETSGGSRAVIIAAAGPDDSLSRTHLDYLARAVDKYDADTAFAHARGGATDDAARLCDQNGIRLVDPAAIGTDDPVGGLQFPSNDDNDSPQHAQTPPAEQRQEQPTRAAGVSPVDVAQRNIVRGGLHGAGAWVVGYCVVFLLSLADNYDYPSGFLDKLTAPGWVFYGAQQVSITRTVTRRGRTQSSQLDVFGPSTVFDGLTTTVPALLYRLVPVVVLLGAGYLVVKNADEPRLDATSTAALGTTLCAGYLVLTVVGRSLFQASASGAELARLPTVGGGIKQITALPTLSGAVLKAGLVYPLVFGTVGALVAYCR